jgi:hypothetical protein
VHDEVGLIKCGNDRGGGILRVPGGCDVCLRDYHISVRMSLDNQHFLMRAWPDWCAVHRPAYLSRGPRLKQRTILPPQVESMSRQ